MRPIRYRQDRRAVCSHKRHSACRCRATDRGDVIVALSVLDVILEVGAHAQEGIKAQCPPEVQPATGAEERGVAQPLPAVYLLGEGRTEADFVAIKPAALVAIRGDLSVDTGPKLELGQWHAGSPKAASVSWSCRPA
jgi:hypothetical protein